MTIALTRPEIATTSGRTRAGRGVAAGRVLSGAAVAFLTSDALGKIFAAEPAVRGTLALGFPRDHVLVIGTLLAACTLVHVVPRSSFLGALLLTAYLGGAVCAHLRVESPLLTHALFPVYVAVVLWAGLWLRSPRLRELVRSGR